MTSQNIFRTVLIFTIILCASFANAAIYRVNGLGGADADFTTISAAVSTAADGDTLYIEGYPNYDGWTATKKLTYIGPGYFLEENPETQANATPAHISGTVTLDPGSEGSVLTGLYIYGTVIIKDDNIVIKRNLIESSSYRSIKMDEVGVSNIIIKKNYIYSYSGIGVGNNCQNIMINNNYLNGSTVIQSASTSALTVDHNVVNGRVELYNSVFSNNIMYSGSFYGDYNSYNNNVCNAAQLTTDNGNIQNVTMDNVFVGEEGNSTDGQWQLALESVAIGADSEDGDCGMFGGLFPYVLSGVPSELPAIYYFYSTSEGTNVSGLRIHVKAKTRE